MSLGPALPRNWYLLGSSAALRRGAILSADIGDRQLIVYRGEDSGAVVAFDAHCVHMGCHLAKGNVVGDKLRCGLHHRMIGSDGSFGPSSSLRQKAHPVCEYLGGVFVLLQDGDATLPLAAVDLAHHACCYAGEHHFPLPWQSLVANGLDIEHLSAVHDRALQEPPSIDCPSEHELRLQYVTRPSSGKLSDRVINWLATDGVHGSIRCLSGTMMLVESRLGRRETFILMSFCPDEVGGTRIRGLVGVKRPPTLGNRLSARFARTLFKAFLYKDLHVLEGLRWHEPVEDHAFGDRAMRQVGAFFRSLPSA